LELVFTIAIAIAIAKGALETWVFSFSRKNSPLLPFPSLPFFSLWAVES
jgi:hypothetical protein